MPTYEELLAQRAELDRQISAARQAELAEAIETIKSLVRKYDLSAEDCGFKSAAVSGSKKAKSAVAAKYRGPNGETWSGRGRAPKWLEALEAQGRQRAEFSIA